MHRVEYLLIGGYAVGFHGYPRPTGDMDIWVRVHPANDARLRAALTEFAFRPEDLPAGLFMEEGKIIRMGLPPLRLEIITGISGVVFEECYARRVSAELDGVPVNVISLEDLRANKKASGRHKDLADLDELPGLMK